MRPAAVVVAGQHDADALAFEHRKRGRAEVENDVVNFCAGVGPGEFQIAGDLGFRRCTAAEEIDARLTRGSRRLHLAACTFMCVVEKS